MFTEKVDHISVDGEVGAVMPAAVAAVGYVIVLNKLAFAGAARIHYCPLATSIPVTEIRHRMLFETVTSLAGLERGGV